MWNERELLKAGDQGVQVFITRPRLDVPNNGKRGVRYILDVCVRQLIEQSAFAFLGFGLGGGQVRFGLVRWFINCRICVFRFWFRWWLGLVWFSQVVY